VRCTPGALYKLLDERDMHVWYLAVWGASVPIEDKEEEAFNDLVDGPRAWWSGRFTWGMLSDQIGYALSHL